MPEVPFVTKESAKKARDFERRFQLVRGDAGIVFVSVQAMPVIRGVSTEFRVILGISRKWNESVGWALIQQVLHEEIKTGAITITGSVFTGVSGACRDESAEGAHPSPAPTNEPG